IFIHNPLHLTCDLVAFNSSIVVLLLAAWRFWPNPDWRPWALPSVLTAILMMSLLAAFGLANHPGGGPAGLLEKLATAPRTVWSSLLSIKLLRGARPFDNSLPQSRWIRAAAHKHLGHPVQKNCQVPHSCGKPATPTRSG